jgi:hypothetical protein
VQGQVCEREAGCCTRAPTPGIRSLKCPTDGVHAAWLGSVEVIHAEASGVCLLQDSHLSMLTVCHPNTITLIS